MAGSTAKPRRRGYIGPLVAFLAVLAVVSFALLGNRFGLFSAQAESADLDLRAASGTVSTTATGSISTSAADTTDSRAPGAEVTDDQLTWTADTQVDIFQITYQNGEGELTAVGRDGQKIVAPGTGNHYTFTVSNTGNVALGYTLTAKAYFNQEEYVIPVEVKCADYNGRFLVGSENAWVPVEELNGLADSGVLSAKHYARYTLSWQWPFEQDDAYDTLLGNLAAADEELTLTIELHAKVWEETDSEAIGGIPQTGDTTKLLLWAALLALSLTLIALVLLLSPRPPQKERKDPHDDGQAS